MQSLSPSTLTSAAGVPGTLTSVVSDANGAAALNYSALQVGLNTAGSLHVLYSVSQDRLFMSTDSGSGWAGSCAPCSSSSVVNSQGVLNCASTTVTKLGNNLSIVWSLTPSSAFAGSRPVSIFVGDNKNQSVSRTLGTWNITPQ